MNLFRSERKLLVITLNEEYLKVVLWEERGQGGEVVSALRRDIREISEEEIPKTIQSAVGTMKAKSCRAVYVVTPQIATTKNIEVPSVDPNEIKSIINLQAGRHTPYSREEIIVGYANIGIYQRNYSKILLVIVNRDVIKKKITILEEAGITVHHVVFSPEVMASFYAKALGLSGKEETFGIIDVAAHTTDFVIGLSHKIVACRNIPIGAQELLKNKSGSGKKFFEEIKKSLDSYQAEDIEKTPSTYILAADIPLIKELRPQLQEVLDAPVKIAPYLDNIKIAPDIRDEIVSIEDDSFLDLIAAAAAYTKAQVDLIPEEVKMQLAIAEQAKEMGKAGILIAILLLVTCGIFISKIYFKNTQLDHLKAIYEPKHVEVEALEKIAGQTRLVKDYLTNRMTALKVIDELYKIIPDEIYLTNIVMDEKGTLKIQGISESMSQVFSFVTALEDSALFKNVKTTSTTAKKERGKDVAAFEIAFKLESAKDDEEEATEDKVATEKEKTKTGE